MELIEAALRAEIDDLDANDVRFIASGRLHELPASLQKAIAESEARTADNAGLVLNMAINYSGRAELADVCRTIAQECLDGTMAVEEITAEAVGERLYRPEIPDVDLFIRRGWYEGVHFWSPPTYREFIFPTLQADVQRAHEKGVLFGYIMTTGTMPLVDMIMEAGVDVLIGVDPVQDIQMDMRLLKDKARGRMALWGGVNGFLTVERGTKKEIRTAVREAIHTLGPEGFILSPVDNVRDTSDATWERVLTFVEAWKAGR